MDCSVFRRQARKRTWLPSHRLAFRMPAIFSRLVSACTLLVELQFIRTLPVLFIGSFCACQFCQQLAWLHVEG